MSQANQGSEMERALAFFKRAQQVAETKNYDYAIDMYFEGLRCAPEAIEEGHIPLCQLGLRRRQEGGKKPSVVERTRFMRGKTPLERMLNAEYLYMKDPEHLPYAEAMLRAATEGGFDKTVDWIANLLFQTNNSEAKPSLDTYLLLKDCYLAIGKLDKAVAASRYAARMKPQDKELQDEYKNLTAELTMQRGKYDSATDFRESINNREHQEKLQDQAKIIKSQEYTKSAVEDARTLLAKYPDKPHNIFGLARALSDLQTDEGENEGIQLLNDAHQRTGDFAFKEEVGRIELKQLRRQIRELDEAGVVDNQQEITELREKLIQKELEHWRECVANYPTDLRMKYEYANILFRLDKYDQALPLYQEVQRDPHRKIPAMSKIGMCFFMKGWFSDAIDVFGSAISSYEIEDDGIAKELRYNLAKAYEENGDSDKALEVYRKIAQVDFSYKDVGQRVDKLRNK